MEKLKELIRKIILGEELILAIFSNLRRRDNITYNKVQVQPVLIQGEIKYQFTYEFEKKVNHKNLNIEETIDELEYLYRDKFR